MTLPEVGSQNICGTGFEPDAGRRGSQAGGRQNQRGRGHYRSGQPGELDSGDTGAGEGLQGSASKQPIRLPIGSGLA